MTRRRRKSPKKNPAQDAEISPETSDAEIDFLIESESERLPEETNTNSAEFPDMAAVNPPLSPVERLAAHGFAWLGIRGGATGWWIQSQDGIVWHKISMAELTCVAREHAPPNKHGKVTVTEINELIAGLKDFRHFTIEDFVPDTNLIHFKNGVYQIDSKTFLPFQDPATIKILEGRRYRTLSMIPTEYDQDAPAVPELDAALLSYFGNDQDAVDRFWEWIGYCLTSSVKLKKALLCYAPHDCGKTTLAHIVQFSLGENNVINMQFSRLCYDKDATASLIDKRVMYDDDAGQCDIHRFEMFKIVSGSDKIPVRPLYIQGYDSYNITKLWLCMNEIPFIENIDENFACRLVILEFKTQFGQNGVKMDRTFESRMCNDEVAKYIIRHGIESLQALLARNEFTGGTSEENLEFMKQHSDIVYRFIKEKCEQKPDYAMTKSDFMAELINFALDAKWSRVIPDLQQLTPRLVHFGIQNSHMDIDGKKTPAYRGIRLRSDSGGKPGKTNPPVQKNPLKDAIKTAVKKPEPVITKKSEPARDFSDDTLDDDVQEEFERRMKT